MMNLGIKTKPKLFYSILVPFRNESENLETLLESLQMIDFPENHFEVIFIDDHSDDEYQIPLNDNYSLIKLLDKKGKKAALQKGIESAEGNVIITTDADCIVPENWLINYAYHFEDGKCDLAFGGVSFYDDTTFFKKIQTLEFASLVGSGASTLNLGLPSMCNGANLAFTKLAFDKVGGYSDNEQIPSGDDEFLMHKIHKIGGKVRFLKSNNVVYTKAQENFRSFIEQRKRWASKWKYYKRAANSLLAILVALFNINNIAAFVFIFIVNDPSFWVLLLLLATKACLEAFFLISVLKSMEKKFSFISFFTLQITYPIYVLLFGLGANFGNYIWKGRSHKL